MYFAPHILEKKVYIEPDRDDKGNTIPGTGGDAWETIGPCRCDDNGAGRQIGVAGNMVVYDYHIVIAGNIKLSVGDYVRALEQDGSVRGEGEVIKPGKCNYLNYSEVWV